MRCIAVYCADFPGRSMHRAEPMPRDDTPVLICDLDGTILRANSFPLWMLYLIGGPLPELGFRARATLSLRAQQLLLRRKLGRIDHEHLMRETQAAWRNADDRDVASRHMPRLLRRLVRPVFEPLLRQIATGQIDAVLSTAAAGEYAIEFGRQLGFRYVLTTPRGLAPKETLNAGNEKLRRVLAFLAERDWMDRPRLLLTDHIDDLPLMRHCSAVGWFGSASAMTRARELSGGTKFVDCGGLDTAAFLHAWNILSACAASRSSASTAA